jgi:uncharacterized protein (TIGR02145 family)
MSYKSILAVAGIAAMFAVGVFAQTTGTFKDSRDGKTYKTVKVGGKTWMADNLNFAAEDSKCYENKDANCAKYGRLYDWNTAKKACPAGYHLPTDDEWTALVNYAGGENKAGKKLKSKAGWTDNGNGMDDYGWSALPGGVGNSGGGFINAGYDGLWWSATENDADGGAWYLYMSGDNEDVGRQYGKIGFFSVRCVQN